MISLIDETHSSEGFVLQLQFDHESEITNLPSATRPFNRVNYAIAYDYGTPLAGSSAICLDSSKTYVFNANGTWNEGGTTVVSSFGGKTGDITLGDGLEMNGNEVRTTGGGLPTTANAGDAMVFNGTAWAKQDGYGYTTPESSVSIPWDGDTTGKETAFGGTLCKLTSDIPVNINNLIGGSVSIIIEGEPMSYTIGDTMLGPLSSEPAGMLYTVSDIILIALTDVTFEEELLHKGIWFTKNDIMLVTNLTYGTPAVVHKIDTKYIPINPVLESAITNHGIGYGNSTTITWDGDTTGRTKYGESYRYDGTIIPVSSLVGTNYKFTDGTQYTATIYIDVSEDIGAPAGTILMAGTGSTAFLVFYSDVIYEGNTYQSGLYLQYTNSTNYMNWLSYGSTHKISSDMVDDTNHTNKFVTAAEKSTWNGKLDSFKSTFQTTAPTADITDGGVHIVYLTSDPATKYSGYIYLIQEA